MLIIGLSLFPKSQLHSIFLSLEFSQLHSIFSIYNGHFFNIYGACKAIDVDTRREVVKKTWKTSAKIGLSLFPKSQLHNISQVLIFLYFPRANCTMFFQH